MGAFITNFQSPVELDDLKDRLDCGGITNLDMILHPEKFSPIEWTVDKEAKIGDVVVFMCAKTSVNHIAHLCKQLKDGGGAHRNSVYLRRVRNKTISGLREVLLR